MKKYLIEITQDENGMSVYRSNDGFEIFQLIGMVEYILNDLNIQARSFFSGTDVNRMVEKNGDEYSVEVKKIKEDFDGDTLY